jgi:endonuclease NucS-like protein
MGAEVHLWLVGEQDQLAEIEGSQLDLESRLEKWVERDISILDPALLVIGRQIQTPGGPMDILCIDAEGDLVIVELKRDRTPREVTAQALDYASWVESRSHDEVTAVADAYLDADLESEFRAKFDAELPETVNADHRVLVVGSHIDSAGSRSSRATPR